MYADLYIVLNFVGRVFLVALFMYINFTQIYVGSFSNRSFKHLFSNGSFVHSSIFTAGHLLRSVHGLISFESFIISDDLHQHSSIQFMCYTIDFYKICRPSLACVFL